jgi:DNA polymerase-1
MENKRLLILVDGSSYLYRAFYALPDLTNSKGHPTGAMHGVLNMLSKLKQQYSEANFAVVFDPRGPTLRNNWYKEYKANRAKMPPELSNQIAPLYEMISALGYPMLKVDGVEADDVIGTLATRAVEDGYDVIISTGDKDFAQLVEENISLINTMDGSFLDEDGVRDKFGVRPDQIVDYLTLVGDTVDNIPGVPKVGPKTAVKWIQTYDGLDGIVLSAHAIKGKVGDNLRAFLEQLPLSRKLVTIIRDIEVGVEIKDLVCAPTDNSKLLGLYEEYEFKTALSQLSQQGIEPDDAGEQPVSSAKPNSEELDIEIILDIADLEDWIDKLAVANYFAFDTETTSLDYMDAELVGISFCCEKGSAAYLPLGHNYSNAPEQISLETALSMLKVVLESKNIFKLGHNLKYDRNVLLNYGIDVQGILHDSMLESYVFDSTGSRHGLDNLAFKYLNGRNTTKYEDVVGKGVKQVNFSQVSVDVAADYASEDAEVAYQLHVFFQEELMKSDNLMNIYSNIEIPLVPVLSNMERAGVNVDPQMLKEQSAELAASLKKLEAEAHELAGEVFNISSPKQLQNILFEKLGLPVVSKTPKGQPSTAESVLHELSNEFALPRVILDYRSLSKLKSTYTDKLPLRINKLTNRVHTSYHQAVTATGRLSSSEPNLQNIPIKSPEGRRIRKAFKAPKGKSILAADYSQIELRIMAHLSGDDGLISAFSSGLDVHNATAAEVFSVPIDKVSTEQRRAAKAINFGLIYGMSAFGLGRQLEIDRGSAQAYINTYFARYPDVLKFMEDTKQEAKKRGFVQTIFGRRLNLPDINAKRSQLRQYAERTAINAPMQGTAADIIKLAMIDVAKWIENETVDAVLVMQVHDELVLEVESSIALEVGEKVKQIMESITELSVPLVVDVGIGRSWEEAH